MDYILNGVFHPLVVSDERAMMREAYRYELDSADGDIALVGTVYSEMQGALMLAGINKYSTLKLLFPGSYTANISGGDPDHIPEMTLEELQQFHSTYYNPSNCTVILYGQLDIARYLKHLDEEFFSSFARREVDLSDKDYVPVEGLQAQENTFPVAMNSAEQPTACYAFRLPGATPEEKEQLSLVVSDMLAEGGAIEKRQQKQMPTASISGEIDTFTPDPIIYFTCSGAQKDLEKFRTLVDEAVAETVTSGCDRDRLLAYCKQNRYNLFRQTQDLDYGVNLASSILYLWSGNGDIDAYRRSQLVLNDMASYVESGSPEELFRKYMGNPAGSAYCLTLPQQGGLEQKYEELARQLAEKKAAMTPEELDALVERTADFRAWSEENASNSMIDAVKVVTAQDLPEELVSAEAQEQNINGLRFVSSQLDADVARLNIYFDTSTLPEELIFPLNFYTVIQGYMDTEEHNAEQLAHLEQELTNDFSISLSIVENADYESMRPVLVASWMTTEEDMEASFALVEEKLFHGLPMSGRDVQNRAGAFYKNLKSAYLSEGDEAASRLAWAKTYPPYAYYWKVFGAEFLNFLKDITEMNSKELDELVGKMEEALSYALTNRDFTVTAVGSERSISTAAAEAERLYKQLPENNHEVVDLSDFIAMPDGDIAVITGGTVYYNYQVLDMKAHSLEQSAKLYVTTCVIDDKLLIPTLRFERGAYGAESCMSFPMLYYSSYRDPQMSDTFDYYQQIAAILGEMELTQEDLNGYIVGCAASFANAYSPMDAAAAALEDVLTGRDTFGRMQTWMKEIKTLTPEDVKELAAEVFTVLSEQGERIAVGGAEQIEANRSSFEYVDESFVK